MLSSYSNYIDKGPYNNSTNQKILHAEDETTAQRE